MCDPHLVYAILEVLTLLQRATENEYIDEVCDGLHVLVPYETQICCSTNPLGSTTQIEPTSLYSSRIAIKLAMKF